MTGTGATRSLGVDYCLAWRTRWSVTDDGGGELGPGSYPLDAALVDHADEDRCTSTTQA